MLSSYQNTYWVKQNKFLAGCYPGNPTPDLIPARVEALIDSGINVIISLMKTNERYSDGTRQVPYDEDFLMLGYNRQVSAKWYNFPIPDYGLPDPKQMLNILDVIDESIAQDKNVFVHCWGGKGRTGTVVGCWLARHGDLTPLDTISELRKNSNNSDQPSPETKEQCDFVRSWKKGF